MAPGSPRSQPPRSPRPPGAVRVHPLPSDELAAQLGPASVAIVIDLLRASTTVATALASGAARVVPVLTVEDARARRGPPPPGVLLGGEREGLPPEGFDLGNSPRDYTPERVAGRDIVFTTSNGTRAIHAADNAGVILIGSLINLTATATAAARAAGQHPDIHIICAGTGGQITEEDVLCAGAYLERLAALGIDQHDDVSRDALQHWRRASSTPDTLLHALRATRGGRNLVAINLDHDIADAARIDTIDTVARFQRASGDITRALA